MVNEVRLAVISVDLAERLRALSGPLITNESLACCGTRRHGP
jgi:hypothetical protein